LEPAEEPKCRTLPPDLSVAPNTASTSSRIGGMSKSSSPARPSPTAPRPCGSRRPATAPCIIFRRRTCGSICCTRPSITRPARSKAKRLTGRSRRRPAARSAGRRMRSGAIRRPMTRSAGSPATMLSIRPASTRSSRNSRRFAMHLTQNWEVRKPGASSRGGIVASQSRTAATVGAEMLAAGGTAVDAAVAAALALAAVEPWNSGLGGIGFMVVHRAGADHAEAVDFGPVAPRGLDPAAYKLTGATKTELFTWPQVEEDRNIHGPLAFAIPSSVRGYAAAVERVGRMPWRDLVAPALALAREGVPVDWFTTVKVAGAAAELRLYDESRRIWLPDGLPRVCPPERDWTNLALGRLADTLERIATAGPDDFYEGDIARAIAADVRAAGGVLSGEDLAGCRARVMPAS